MCDWQPTICMQNLRLRAQLLEKTRNFFSEHGVLEVETPLLCARTVTEPNIQSFHLLYDNTKRYLQTSPEYAMKRLLASGAPDIYQVCKSFRVGEQGALHNSEFTLIEWYRSGFSLKQMMQETIELISSLLLDSNMGSDVEYLSYNEACSRAFGLSLSSLPEKKLKQIAIENGLVLQQDLSLNEYMDFIFSSCVVPTFSENSMTAVFHYPAGQAALAKLNAQDPSVAERFEVFYRGVELANGYLELIDPQEQLERFLNDQRIRKARNLPVVEIDKRLISSQQHGLPACTGVAVGFDRVMMLAAGASSLSEVMSFDWPSA